MWRDEIEHDLGLAVATLAEHFRDGSRVDRRSINCEAFAKIPEPAVILIELLSAGQRSPRNELMNIGVSGRVADMFTFDARPCRRGDDLPRLRHQIAITNLFVLALLRKVRVVTTSHLPKGFPRFDRNLAIGLRREIQNNFGRINVGFDARAALRRSAVIDFVVQLPEPAHLVFSIPTDSLATVAELVGQRPKRSKATVGVGIITFDNGDLRSSDARHKVAFTSFPILHVDLSEFGGRVVKNRCQHHIALDAEVAYRKIGEAACNGFIYLPVTARFPNRIDRSRQRMNEGMHLRSVQIVLLVPGGRGQYDVGVKAARRHTEVERHDEIEFALRRRVPPRHLRGLLASHFSQILALQPMPRPEEMAEKIFVPLAG